MRTKAFWASAFERAVRAFAETLAAILSASVITYVAPSVEFAWSWERFDVWLAISGVAALISLLTSIASGVKTGSTSLVPGIEVIATLDDPPPRKEKAP